jgi:hypothetical protein
MRLCAYCDRVMRELNRAFEELSYSSESQTEESSARMQLGNVITLINLHETEHIKKLQAS